MIVDGEHNIVLFYFSFHIIEQIVIWHTNNHFHFGSFGILKGLVNIGFRFHVNNSAAVEIYAFLFTQRHCFFDGFLVGTERQVHTFKGNLIYAATQSHVERLFLCKFAK